jgi:hypothetical protein
MTMMKQMDCESWGAVLPSTRRFARSIPLVVVWIRQDAHTRSIPISHLAKRQAVPTASCRKKAGEFQK